MVSGLTSLPPARRDANFQMNKVLMFKLAKPVAVIGVALFAAGCINTQEMPLAPNVVRLDTHVSGLLFAGQAEIGRSHV